jgi:hypothetical protein
MLAVRSLDFLPDSLLTALLLLLPAHGRARCALLSKRWRNLVRSPAAWRTIIVAEGAHDAETVTAIRAVSCSACASYLGAGTCTGTHPSQPHTS